MPRFSRLKRALAAVAFTAAAAGLLYASLATIPKELYAPSAAARDADVYEPGEALLHHALPRPIVENYHMPLASTLAAGLYNHAGPDFWKFWRLFSGVFSFILIAALGLAASGPLAALAAPALLLADSLLRGEPHLVYWRGDAEFLEGHMVWLVLLAAALLARRSKFASLAIGASLLFRSTLAFLPPLLDRRWRIWIVPYLFLLPWIVFNAQVHHRLNIFEYMKAGPGVVGGALGAVEKNDLFLDQQGRLEPMTSNGAAAAVVWSAKEALRSPLRYAEGFLARLKHVFALRPALFLLALLAAWRRRKDHAARALAVFSGYYLFVHCLMAVSDVYFEPLWPVLAVLAALNLPPAKSDQALQRRTDRFLHACLAILLVLCLKTYWTLGAYALSGENRARPSIENFEKVLAAHPEEAWLWYERGRLRLSTGKIAEAARDFQRADELRPGRDEVRLASAYALALTGDSAPFEAWNREHPLASNMTGWLLRVDVDLRAGRDARARRYVDKKDFLGPGADGERWLCAAAPAILQEAAYWLGGRPVSERLRLISVLAAKAPSCAALQWAVHQLGGKPSAANLAALPAQTRRAMVMRAVADARAAAAKSDDAAALNILDAARPLAEGGAERHEINAVYLELKRWETVLRDFIPIGPDGISSLIDHAKAAHGIQNSSPLALKFMAQAEARDTGGQRHAVALAYQDIGRCDKALPLLEELIAIKPGAALLSDRGLCLYLIKRPPEAIDSLNKALALDSGWAAAYLNLGSIYEAQGRGDEALKVYERGVKAVGPAHPLRGVLTQRASETLPKRSK